MSAELDALADELDVVASWHSGPRSQRVQRLAEQVRAISGGQSVPVEEIAVSAATTVAPAYVPEDDPDQQGDHQQ